MPIQPSDIKVIDTNDVLDVGRTKLNDNFEQLRRFVNFLETTGGSSGASELVTQVNHGLAVGDVVRYSGSAFVKATSQNTTTSAVLGVVSGVTSSDSFTLSYAGRVGGFTNLTPGVRYYLQDNGSVGVNPGTVNRPVIVAVSHNEGIIITSGSSGALSSMTDVDTSGVFSGSVLKYTGSKWVPGSVSLSSLSDVSVSPQAGHTLVFDNNGRWVSSPAAGGGDMYRDEYGGSAPGVVKYADVAFNINQHSHSISDINGLQSALDTKARTNGTNTFTGTQTMSGGIVASGGIETSYLRSTGAIELHNNVPIYMRDASNNPRAVMSMATNDVVYIGSSTNRMEIRGSGYVNSNATMRAPTPPTGDDTDLINRRFFLDNAGTGGGGSGNLDGGNAFTVYGGTTNVDGGSAAA